MSSSFPGSQVSWFRLQDLVLRRSLPHKTWRLVKAAKQRTGRKPGNRKWFAGDRTGMKAVRSEAWHLAVIGTHEGGVRYHQQMLATDRGYLQPANEPGKDHLFYLVDVEGEGVQL